MARRATPRVALVLAAALIGVGCASSGPSRASGPTRGRTGSASIGDPYFPSSGNGGYDVTHYDIHISYSPAHPEIRATTTIESVAGRPLRSFDLDLSGLTVDDVTVDGHPARFSRRRAKLVIHPAVALVRERRFTTRVRYHGVPHTITDPSEPKAADAGQLGWTRSANGNVFVVSEPVGARTWFPANDHPADKATFAVSVTVPDSVAVAANGTLHRQAVPHHRQTWRWSMGQPMATYLATVVIAPMRAQHETSPAGVPIRNFFRNDAFRFDARTFTKTGAMIDFFSSRFGAYPFVTYGAVVVKPEIGYALETQSMSVFGSDMMGTDLDAEMTVAHELAHQWFGDSVGIRRWADIWLNEGWATYAQYLWAAHADPAFDLDRTMIDLRASDGAKLTPPHDPGPNGLFSGSIYERGALTLHALRHTIGDAKFFELAKQWNAKYRYSTATTAEFVALTNAVTGRDLTTFFHAWLDADALPRLP